MRNIDKALLRAARKGNLNTVKNLIEHNKADVNAKSKRYESALSEALIGGHEQIISYLIEEHDLEGDIIVTALTHAIIEDKINAARFLLYNYTNVLGFSLTFELAISMGKFNLLVLMIENYKFTGDGLEMLNDPRAKEFKNFHYEEKFYLLKYAFTQIRIGHKFSFQLTKIIKVLFEEDIVINARDEEGNTPLHFLISNIKTANELTALLNLSSISEANMNTQNFLGNTALHEVLQNRSLSITDKISLSKSLISNGININIKNNEGNTPLHLIAISSNNKVSLIELFLDCKAEVNAQNTLGNTPLHEILQNTKLNLEAKIYLAKILINNGANVNIQNKEGNTPLHLIAKSPLVGLRNMENLIRLLVNNSADISQLNNDNKSSLQLLEENKYINAKGIKFLSSLFLAPQIEQENRLPNYFVNRVNQRRNLALTPGIA